MNINTPEQQRRFKGKKGDVYGRLTLTGKNYMSRSYYHPRRMVEADCECGITRDYLFELLRKGETKSCGCLRKEVTSERAKTHGLSLHPLYIIRAEMLSRCYNPNHVNFKNYGGRGIEVCDEWIDDFTKFYNWCINNGWSEGYDLQLDRRCNDGNYSPLNCRFITSAKNNRNRRDNRNYTAFGETKCITDWATDKRCLVGYWTLRSRMDKEHWEGRFEEALTIKDDYARAIKNHKRTKQLTAFGETKNITDWSKDKRCVVGFDRLRDRIAWGWEHERAITEIQDDGKLKRLTIFGETKTMKEWSEDSRCVVSLNAIRERKRSGWQPEAIITTPLSEKFKGKNKTVTESAR